MSAADSIAQALDVLAQDDDCPHVIVALSVLVESEGRGNGREAEMLRSIVRVLRDAAEYTDDASATEFAALMNRAMKVLA